MARLENVRIGWHQFEREDRPAFVRWRAREFGALLSKAREVEDQIRDAQALIHEVEMEMRRHIQDPRSAYHRVMYRRQNPGAAMETEPEYQGDRGAAGGTRKLSEFEQETLFQEWVKSFSELIPIKWMTKPTQLLSRFLSLTCFARRRKNHAVKIGSKRGRARANPEASRFKRGRRGTSGIARPQGEGTVSKTR